MDLLGAQVLKMIGFISILLMLSKEGHFVVEKTVAIGTMVQMVLEIKVLSFCHVLDEFTCKVRL